MVSSSVEALSPQERLTWGECGGIAKKGSREAAVFQDLKSRGLVEIYDSRGIHDFYRLTEKGNAAVYGRKVRV